MSGRDRGAEVEEAAGREEGCAETQAVCCGLLCSALAAGKNVDTYVCRVERGERGGLAVGFKRSSRGCRGCTPADEVSTNRRGIVST